LSAVKPSTWKTSCSSSFISRSTAAGDPHSSSAIPVSTLGRMLTWPRMGRRGEYGTPLSVAIEGVPSSVWQ